MSSIDCDPVLDNGQIGRLLPNNPAIQAGRQLLHWTMSDSNPLAPDALSQLLVDLTSHDGHAVQIDSPVTALALLAHTIHTALGFRLTKPASVTEPASDDPQQRNRLAHEWIASKSHDESFSFTYTHTQSSMVFEVRINRLGNRVVFNALGVEVGVVISFP